MINKLNEATALKFKNLTPEEKSKKGILGRLYGKVADFTNGTRNGRKYSEELWENLLKSDLIQERFANGGIFGQLCHPDYEEVDMEKVAIVMPEPPVRDDDGQLVAYVDILDTPCGKIAYQLAKYGYKLGISSRGTGDLIEGPDGEEVDPDTYQLNAFDLVELPAVKSARLSFVESLDSSGKSLKQSLTESYAASSDLDKKIMKESLDALGIKLTEGAAEENAMFELKDEITDYLLATLKDSQWDDNIAFEIQSKFPSYNADWCGEDPSDFYSRRVDSTQRSYCVALTELLFENAPRELNESASQELDKYYREWKDKNPDVKFEPLIKEYGKSLSDIMYSEDVYNDFVKWANDKKHITIKGLDEAFNPAGYTKAIMAINDGIEDDSDPEELQKYLQNIVGYCKSIADDYGLLIEDVNDPEAVSDNEQGEEVVDDKSDEELVAEFQESLLKIKKLEEDNLSLQEQLSVGNAKEVKLTEELTRYKNAVVELSDDVKNLKPFKAKVNALTESISEKDKIISTKETRINWLVESRKKVQEELISVKKLNENLTTKINNVNNELGSTNEELEKLSKQLDSSNTLVEKYKRSYKALKEAYVDVKASNYGLRKEEVLGRLGESYKIKDIEMICEELSQLKTNMRKLPFRLTEDTRVSVKQSKNEYIKDGVDFGDDLISDSLLQLANIK